MSEKSIRIERGILIAPDSEFHRKTIDLFIENGKITEISEASISKDADLVISAESKYIMPGMFDLRCQLKDPGLEHQETLESGAAAAAFSGFTGLAVQPTTEPATQSKSQIDYIIQKGKNTLTDLHPVGAATLDLDSEDISEMYDMRSAGAVGFSNGDKAYPSSGVLMRALLYTKEFGGLVMSHAIDGGLMPKSSVNESPTTIHTGLKQQPKLAETSQIKREIDIAAYTGCHIHFSHISSAESVEIIREAQKSGISVSCDVSIWHLIYTDESVLDYDTNYKVSPPFRAEEDRLGLLAGIKDGTIAAIVSDHNPQNIENKRVEFDYASNGINGLQSFYSVYNAHLSKEISLEKFVELTASNPRRLLNLSPVEIGVGSSANLWVADPEAKWTLDKSSNRSKSENNPVFGNELTGKCIFVVNGNKSEHYES